MSIAGKKVFVTGMGAISSLGGTVEEMFAGLLEGKSGVQSMHDWGQYEGLNTQVGAPAVAYNSKLIQRQARRTMSPMSEMAYLATKEALAQAGLDHVSSQRSLICMGSTTGSPPTFEEYFRKFIERNGPAGQLSTSFFKIMNHSVASNVAVGLGYNGPQLAIASACSTSTQAMVTGWELISSGMYDLVIAGGADELHHTSAAIFDNVHAASKGFNQNPDQTPRPFDADRDGLVVSEGAGIVILESEQRVQSRGAKPIAEILGGSYYCNGTHMTQPQVEGMVETMKSALTRARIEPGEVGYVNAHGTGTLMGDVKEARATLEVFGEQVPVSTIKGHIGHTLAACGALEAIASIKMLEEETLIPTRNLANIDPEVGNLNLITDRVSTSAKVAISNSFAFGGMNASVVLRVEEK